MATMIREVCEALREAGASDEKAANAPEVTKGGAVALYEPRVTDTRNGIAELRTDVQRGMAELRTDLQREIAELCNETQRQIAELRAELKLQRWMLGVNTALVLGVLVKLFVG